MILPVSTIMSNGKTNNAQACARKIWREDAKDS